MKYKAFISYSHRDEIWAAWLHKALETYRLPRHFVGQPSLLGPVPARLSPIFRDREELPSATDLGAILRDALAQSACQIVICSPHAAQSRWVNEEILTFKRLGREDRIFCLIVGGEPYASADPKQFARECFPHALRFKIGADGELTDIPTEPIAADVREGKDGKQNAKLKIMAGILGVGLDALRQRELQRKHRQMAVIAGAALTGMVVTTGLATAALVARANAERQRVRAEAEAETARQTTNFMVDLFRISDPGEARGNTVTAREMLDKGAARIESELADQPAIQATLMDTVGTVYMRLGLYRDAMPLLAGALQRRQQLAQAEAPVMASSLNHLGELLALQANFADAEKRYREALSTREDTDTPLALTAWIESLRGLGNVLARQGRLQEAEEALREALAVERRAYGDTHREIARTLKDLAAVIYQRGNLNDAIPVMEEALSMQRATQGDLPHPDTVALLNDLGVLLHAGGQYERAEPLMAESLVMARTLLGDKHPDIAMALNNYAFLLHDKGDYARAEETYRQALAMQRALVGESHPDVAMSLSNLAFIQHDRGDLQAALVTLRESLNMYRRIFPGDHPETARALHTLGYWMMEERAYARAGNELAQALAMRRRLLGEEHPDVASTLTHLAMLQVEMRQYDRALAAARSATDIFSKTLSPTHWRTAVAKSVSGAALAGLRQFAEAEALLTESQAVLTTDSGVLPDYQRWNLRYLARYYTQTNQRQQAARVNAEFTALEHSAPR